MTTKFHSEAPLGEIHIAHNWEYASAASRMAASGFVALDIHKLALQTDDMSMWVLLSTTPSWRRISSPIYNNRGSYNASTNLFPATGGSGVAGAIMADDLWYISVAGTLGGTPVVAGDAVAAVSDAPLQNAAKWLITGNNTSIITNATLIRDSDNGIVGKTSGKINFKNIARTFTSFFRNTNSASRQYDFPDKDIIVAGTVDITTAIMAGIPFLGTTGGTVNAFTASGASITNPPAYGQCIIIRMHLASTSTAPTIDIGNGSGVKSITLHNIAPMWPGDMSVNCNHILCWNGSNWEVLNPVQVKVGTIIDSLSNSIPYGYLSIPSVATYVLRTDFPALFAVLGTLFGNTTGSNFGLPIIPPGWATVSNAGSVGALTVGQVISHSHTYPIGNGTGVAMPDYNPFDGNNGAVSATTNLTGTTANYPAGIQVLKLVKF